MKFKVQDNSIIFPDYFRDKRHIEKRYTDGLYGKFPPSSRVNIYDPVPNTYCTNLMEWAYNNPYQPFAELDGATGKRLPLLDGSHANSFSILGCMKEIWKDFVREEGLLNIDLDSIDINDIEERFWRFYTSLYSSRFEKAVSVLQEYVRKRRADMTEEQRKIERTNYPEFRNEDIWIDGCRDYLRHLIFVSPRGYIYEIILFAALAKITGEEVRASSASDERKGIDGFVKDINVSVKPSSYKSIYISPLDKTCFAIYEKKCKTYPDLVFKFLSGEKFLTKRNKWLKQ